MGCDVNQYSGRLETKAARHVQLRVDCALNECHGYRWIGHNLTLMLVVRVVTVYVTKDGIKLK